MSDNCCARAAEYRRRAEQARTMARWMTVNAHKRQFLEDAEFYDALAEQAEVQERDSRTAFPTRDPAPEV
jgi:predicted adenine nucleotide alpha hydrolase (AANH) superfamily ATPase